MKFLEVFKNRTVLGITCIVLALIMCFVVSPLISRELQYLSEKKGISYAIDLLRKSVNNGHPVLLIKDYRDS